MSTIKYNYKRKHVLPMHEKILTTSDTLTNLQGGGVINQQMVLNQRGYDIYGTEKELFHVDELFKGAYPRH